jgi:hypothetical protein
MSRGTAMRNAGAAREARRSGRGVTGVAVEARRGGEEVARRGLATQRAAVVLAADARAQGWRMVW